MAGGGWSIFRAGCNSEKFGLAYYWFLTYNIPLVSFFMCLYYVPSASLYKLLVKAEKSFLFCFVLAILF